MKRAAIITMHNLEDGVAAVDIVTSKDPQTLTAKVRKALESAIRDFVHNTTSRETFKIDDVEVDGEEMFWEEHDLAEEVDEVMEGADFIWKPTVYDDGFVQIVFDI